MTADRRRGRQGSAGRDGASRAHEGQPFPLVLLDHLMPEMDGFMLAEEIRRTPELAGATLMMLSSADRRDTAARCQRTGRRPRI